jgi:hypothetical protein
MADTLDDRALITQLVRTSAAALPLPKPKAPKKTKAQASKKN